MISLSMRAGVAIPEIVKQLQGITCSKGEEVSGISCPDIIGRAISDFSNLKKNKQEPKKSSTLKCPDCGEELEFSGGCVVCTNCGWSKCS